MQLSLIGAAILATGHFVLAAPTTAPTATTTANITLTAEGYAPQFSPNFPNLNVSSEANPVYNDGPLDLNTTLSKETMDLSKYPDPWESPDVKHSEVQAIVKMINWDLVPKNKVRKTKKDDLVFKGYNEDEDPDCWWSANMCVTPKVSYLPPDYYTCPTKGEWGLTYDDGPFNLRDDDDKDAAKENPYAEPALYNYLAKEDLKATLFYIGSNVVTYPAAARRALADGHTLCSHTWSHPAMTTQSNEKVVAELYWSLKAIKEATGVTPKCWRPPQGDVDDRVRSIAWQMGLHTVIWDKDTDDWDMPAPGGGNLAPSKVDAKFKKWIKEEQAGTSDHGVVVLEHELNHATVNMTMKWLPTVKENFRVVSAMQCNNVLQPYWETDFTYPSIHNTTA
ncbi:MAG: hypothetical protein EXX96DRAFT_524781 [Benjaminiella poitrasii]|nr:MAG: hypothetical protein EXX96DRAFT_524781 [Benjaminiella poitrasii]